MVQAADTKRIQSKDKPFFLPQIRYTYVQNDPVNYVDLWGLQCQKEKKSDDVGVVFLPGDDNAIYVTSTNKNPVIIVVNYDGGKNDRWNAATGTATVYENMSNSEFDLGVRYPVATVPIVSGGNGFEPCDGILQTHY